MSTATAEKMITEKQAEFIRSLCAEVRPDVPVNEEGLATLTRKQASFQIESLLAKRAQLKAENEATAQAVAEAVGAADPETFALDEGYYTVVMEGEGHRTFRVKTVKGGALEGRRIISFLMGSDNTSDYQGFGFVSADGVNFWKRFREETLLGHAVQVLLGNVEQAQKDYALHSGNCYVCGRLLTEPTSIELGIGPVCRGDA